LGEPVHSGADAAVRALALNPGLFWLTTLYRLPGVRAAGRSVYGWIARHRRRL
jgi:hypothetical protein